MRSALDVLATRLAASRGTVIDPALIANGRAAVKRDDIKAMIDADLAFHTALYRAAGNPLIEQSALLHWHHIRRAMGEALQSSLLREPVWDEHEAIANAVNLGDAALAEQLMQRHCSHSSTNMGAQMDSNAKSVADGKSATPQLRGSQLLR